jgi:NTE family protein
VLRHEHDRIAPVASEWLRHAPGAQVHHVRGAADVERVARLIAGRATCLVLSGGGARGFAHIGVIRALEEAGRPIDAVGGTSIGAIMGAGAAAGWSSAEMTERFRRTFVATNPLSDYTLPIVSLIAGRKVARLLQEEFGDRDIVDLPLPYFCVSSNLTSGRAVAHRAGPLVRWLRASVAIPGVLPPVVEGGEVFVDGGATNNLPVDVMRGLGRGTVIGVDVGANESFVADDEAIDAPPAWRALLGLRARRRRVNILQILVRSGMVNSAAVTATHRDMTDLLLTPPLAAIDMLDWRAFDRAIEAGYRHARERLATTQAPRTA